MLLSRLNQEAGIAKMLIHGGVSFEVKKPRICRAYLIDETILFHRYLWESDCLSKTTA